jgi:uncharacterized hydrophobic protein (TIGR00271 family)
MADSPEIQTTTVTRFQRWLQIDEASKPAIYSQTFESARFFSLGYWLELIFSAAIATFGLVLNSPAVIIGAMLISPLMGPIMATGLALALGDLYLSIKALTNLVVSIATAIGLSAFIVWLVPFHSATSEVLSRTDPNLLDLGVAIVSGLAGSVIVCRGGGGGGVTALPGVAIAVALMPPLCAMGFGFGSGGNLELVGGAGLLFLTNIVAIVSSAFGVFLLVGMNSRPVRGEMTKRRGQDPLAKQLAPGRLADVLGGQHVVWRILLLAILLGTVAVPLKRALTHVAGETLARNAVQKAVQNLAPANAIVSQSVDIGRNDIDVRLVSVEAIQQNKVDRAEQIITNRTHRKATIAVEQIARRGELTEILSRLNAFRAVAPPQPAAPQPVKGLEETREELIARAQSVISGVLPKEVTLQHSDIASDQTGFRFNINYSAARDLDKVSQELILKDLQDKLQTPNVTLTMSRETRYRRRN